MNKGSSVLIVMAVALVAVWYFFVKAKPVAASGKTVNGTVIPRNPVTGVPLKNPQQQQPVTTTATALSAGSSLLSALSKLFNANTAAASKPQSSGGGGGGGGGTPTGQTGAPRNNPGCPGLPFVPCCPSFYGQGAASNQCLINYQKDNPCWTPGCPCPDPTGNDQSGACPDDTIGDQYACPGVPSPCDASACIPACDQGYCCNYAVPVTDQGIYCCGGGSFAGGCFC
jgi:hypothetical protein